jgi:uncharacterized protein
MTAPTADVALVTGASGGIGADIARILARRGLRLALVARSADRLTQLAGELSAAGAPAPLTLALDLAKPDGPEQLQRLVREAGGRVNVLVNNAGFGLAGEVFSLDSREQLEMIDLNVRALVDLTLRFSPDLMASRGRIMNVASVAAFIPGPGMAVYYASKAFVLSFSEAISEEFKASGVTVTALCPGFTLTGFQARAGLPKGLSRLAPSTSSMQVAQAGVDAMFAGRRRTVPGLASKLFTRAAPFIPRAALLPTLLGAQTNRRRGA